MNFISRSLQYFNQINSSRNYPFLILLSIIAYEVVKIYFQAVFKDYHEAADFFDNSWTLSGVIGSTLLGTLSDRFIGISWRKPILLLGILFSFITSIAFLHPFLHDPSNVYSILFFVLLNGFSASYIGAARAFFLDKYHKKKVFYFSITVIAQCLPWLIIGGLLTDDIILTISLKYIVPSILIIAFFANLLFVNDNRKADIQSKHFKNEIKNVAKKYFNFKDCSIIVSFFILSVSFHLMPYLGVYAFKDSVFYEELFVIGLGLIIGVFISSFFIKTPTLIALKTGYAACVIYFISLIIVTIVFPGYLTKTVNHQIFIFSVMSGSLWILSLKSFLLKSKSNEDGLILGFIDSIQSFGEFVGAIISSILSSMVVYKNGINVLPFLFLVVVAFIITSIGNFFRNKKNKRQTVKSEHFSDYLSEKSEVSKEIELSVERASDFSKDNFDISDTK